MTYDKRKRYIGNSFSLCIRDIMTGKMPLKCVKGIYSGTRISNFDELLCVIEEYKRTVWEEFTHIEIMKAVNGIFFGNKVFYQVRLNHGKTKVFRKKWVTVKEFKKKDYERRSVGNF
tara:strand:+ start:268 stop:618 length:351 start_codon:yes stop_codon:yes gene_type:complete